MSLFSESKKKKSINNKMLVLLNLEGCCRLKILSESICCVKSLETLNVSGCSQLEKLPEHMGDMESLAQLLADGIENEQLLSSIVHLKCVRKLSLRGYSSNQDSPSSTSSVSLISSWLSPRGLNWKALLPTSLAGRSFLRELKFDSIVLSEGAMDCVDFRSLSSLEVLDLSGNRFFNLPSGICHLPKLQFLNVINCIYLLLISELPSSLEELVAYNCTSMERMRMPIQSNTKELHLAGCQNLTEIEGMEGLDLMKICFDDYRLSKNCKRSLVEAFSKRNWYDIVFYHDGIPDWFSYRGDQRRSLSFHLPSFFEWLAIWVVFEPDEHDGSKFWFNIKNKSNGTQLYELTEPGFFVKRLASWVTCARAREMKMEGYCGEELELYLGSGNVALMKEIGVHVIVEEPDSFDNSESEWEWVHDIDKLQGTTSCANFEERDETDSQESEWKSEWESDDDIDKLQGTTSSADIEKGGEIDGHTGTDRGIHKHICHCVHHPLFGSISCSTNEQWKIYLREESPAWDFVACAFGREC